jgi:poly-gamma-glutamate synthesis protein (capsule biosynthesis protein)
MRATRRAVVAGTLAATGGCLGSFRDETRDPPPCPATVDADAARIGLTGDVMLGRNVNDRWIDGPTAGVWGGTLDRLQTLDGTIVNLECTVASGGQRRPGRTYYFRADPEWAIPALEEAGVAVASLANNHLLDFGPAALAETREHLADAGIAHPGAGADRETAVEPATVEIGGVRVAVVALTDQSASYAAGPSAPGTAFTSLSVERLRVRRRLRAVIDAARAAEPDLVVASLHWGPNWEVEPSDDQRRTARWLIDNGVDVVHGHSAHVIQGVETYRGRPIVYDAGDFVDDYVIKPDLHNDRSFLFELVVAEGHLDHLRLRPVEIVDGHVEPAGDEAAAWLRGRMRTLSATFDTPVERAGRGLRIPLDCAD